MTEMGIVGAVTEYRGASLDRVQQGAGPMAGTMDHPAHTGTGGRT
jgi:hypothetical protein